MKKSLVTDTAVKRGKKFNPMIKMMIESGQYCEKCECHIAHCTCTVPVLYLQKIIN